MNNSILIFLSWDNFIFPFNSVFQFSFFLFIAQSFLLIFFFPSSNSFQLPSSKRSSLQRLYLHLSHSATQVRSSLLPASLSLEPTSEREGEWISLGEREVARKAKGEEAARGTLRDSRDDEDEGAEEKEEEERERAGDPVWTCVGLDLPKLVSRAHFEMGFVLLRIRFMLPAFARPERASMANIRVPKGERNGG